MLSKQPSSSSGGSLGNNELLFRNRITISLWLHNLKGKWPFSGIRVSNGHVCCPTSISVDTHVMFYLIYRCPKLKFSISGLKSFLQLQTFGRPILMYAVETVLFIIRSSTIHLIRGFTIQLHTVVRSWILKVLRFVSILLNLCLTSANSKADCKNCFGLRD